MNFELYKINEKKLISNFEYYMIHVILDYYENKCFRIRVGECLKYCYTTN